MSTPEKPRIIALFDVDGTLTIPRGEITPEMMKFMQELSKKVTVGIVGGKGECTCVYNNHVFSVEVD
jgi:phosphomannomutase